MFHEYHVISRYIYSGRYYPRFHVAAVGFGTYYPWMRGSAFYFLQSVPTALETDDNCSATNSLDNAVTFSVGFSVTEF
jgi:hypothetical protein